VISFYEAFPAPINTGGGPFDHLRHCRHAEPLSWRSSRVAGTPLADCHTTPPPRTTDGQRASLERVICCSHPG
jgi:hypothetical protein